MNQAVPFHPATVERLEAVSDDLFCLHLRVDPAVARSFTRPGQYHLLKVDGLGPKPFAIANAPGSDRFEYLVRRGFPLANALGEPGTEVSASLAEGPGFPLEATKGRDLLLVTTGTGAAPMRAVLQVVRAQRGAWGRVSFVLGGRHPADFAWSHEWPDWAADRVELVRTVLAAEPGWSGGVGHVVAHLPAGDLGRTSVFLVGAPELVDEVKQAVAARGVDPKQVFLNL